MIGRFAEQWWSLFESQYSRDMIRTPLSESGSGFIKFPWWVDVLRKWQPLDLFANVRGTTEGVNLLLAHSRRLRYLACALIVLQLHHEKPIKQCEGHGLSVIDQAYKSHSHPRLGGSCEFWGCLATSPWLWLEFKRLLTTQYWPSIWGSIMIPVPYCWRIPLLLVIISW